MGAQYPETFRDWAESWGWLPEPGAGSGGTLLGREVAGMCPVHRKRVQNRAVDLRGSGSRWPDVGGVCISTNKGTGQLTPELGVVGRRLKESPTISS